MNKAKIAESKPVILRKIADLKPYDKNAKSHTPEQVAAIAASIKEFGFRRHIEITADGTIINGHGRALAAASLGFASIPCVVVDDMTNEQVRAYRLTDNKTNEGGYDAEILSQELYDLSENSEIDMGQFFSSKEMAFSIEDMGLVDLDGISDDLENEVGNISSATQNFIDGETDKMTPAHKVMGFKEVNQSQARTLRKFMDFVEGKSDSKGAGALTDFCREFLGI